MRSPLSLTMIVIQLHHIVKSEHIARYTEATLDKAELMLKEVGVIRVNVLQDSDDPQHFILHEIFRDREARFAYLASENFIRWRDAVSDLLAQAPRAEELTSLFPDESS